MNDIVLIAVGDIALSKGLRKHSRLFEPGLESYINNSDVIVGNFELPFSNRLVPYHQYTRTELVSDVDILPQFVNINWTVLCLSNNHAIDWGEEGIITTRHTLQNLGYKVIGAGVNYDEASAPAIITAKETEICIINVSKPSWPAKANMPGTNPVIVRKCIEQIKQNRSKGRVVVVSVHWGSEYTLYPAPNDVLFARTCVDSGASVVFGHHPHVVQPIEKYKNGVIAYSLGNFLFDSNIDKEKRSAEIQEWSQAGVILKVVIGNDYVKDFTVNVVGVDRDYGVEILQSEKVKKYEQVLQKKVSRSGDTYYREVLDKTAKSSLTAWRERFSDDRFGTILLIIKTIRVRHLKIFLYYIRRMLK